jgi:site-specific DNA-methyltransferase (adenine-specific)
MDDNLNLPTLSCLRCEHVWYPNRPSTPKVCPKCKSPYWDKPKDYQVQKFVQSGNQSIEESSPQLIKEVSVKYNTAYYEKNGITIINDDILTTNSIQNESIDLIITSPPYNIDIHYNSHSDNMTYNDYLEFTYKWIKKCFELTKSEGRFLLNIPLDKNKEGQQSVGADITKIAKDIGWKYHSTIIWNEGNISRRTAWGSFMSASAPYVIAPVELILILYKDSWKKTQGSRISDITKQEFMDWTNGLWTFPGQSKKGAGGHPAPFPIELPKRCIKLFSYVGDTVLDPFLGSGTTLMASFLYQRKGIGVDIDKDYCNLAIKRLEHEAHIIQPSLLR